MAIKKNKERIAITLTKSQWKQVKAEAEDRGISKSKLVEFTLRKLAVIS